VVAIGSTQATCSTIYLADDLNFTDISVGALWEETLEHAATTLQPSFPEKKSVLLSSSTDGKLEGMKAYHLWFDPSVLVMLLTRYLVERMTLYYDTNTDDYHNAPRVKTRVSDFGSTSTLRYLPRGQPSQMGSAYLQRLRLLVASACAANCERPTILVAHSLDDIFALQLLACSPLQWHAAHVQHLVTLSTPWGDYVQEMLKNIFDCLCCMLVALENKEMRSVKAESVEFMLIMQPAPPMQFEASYTYNIYNNWSSVGSALWLFDRMCRKHDPPRSTAMNLGSSNVMVDAYYHVEWFLDAIVVFGKMVDKRCALDALSYNNLIDWLGKNKILEEALDKEGRDGVQVTPMPWPSFFGITISRHLLESLSLVFYCSVTIKKSIFTHCHFCVICWKHCFEFL
jgi:hypothetical protein